MRKVARLLESNIDDTVWPWRRAGAINGMTEKRLDSSRHVMSLGAVMVWA
jgi:hypothetical protein